MIVTYVLHFNNLYYVDFYSWRRYSHEHMTGTESLWLVPQIGFDCA